MTEQGTDEFDFEEWRRLATEDPEAFEARREALLAGIIAQAPARLRPRMQGLQWRVDRLREQAGTPMAACLRMSQMMWESVLGSHGLLDQLQQLSEPRLPGRPEPRPAVVLAFPPEKPESGQR